MSSHDWSDFRQLLKTQPQQQQQQIYAIFDALIDTRLSWNNRDNYFLKTFEIGWIFYVRGRLIPGVKFAIRSVQARPATAPFFNLTVNLSKHRRDNMFLFDSLNFCSRWPEITQIHCSAIELVTFGNKLKRIHSS